MSYGCPKVMKRSNYILTVQLVLLSLHFSKMFPQKFLEHWTFILCTFKRSIQGGEPNRGLGLTRTRVFWTGNRQIMHLLYDTYFFSGMRQVISPFFSFGHPVCRLKKKRTCVMCCCVGCVKACSPLVSGTRQIDSGGGTSVYKWTRVYAWKHTQIPFCLCHLLDQENK